MKGITICKISEAAEEKVMLHEEEITPKKEEGAPMKEVSEEKKIRSDVEMINPEELNRAQVPKKYQDARMKVSEKGGKE